MTIPFQVPNSPILTPADAGYASLADLSARRVDVADKLFCAHFGTPGAAPVTAVDHLEVLALSAAAARAAIRFRALEVLNAVRAGATWEQVAAATGVPAGELVSEVCVWADGQLHLYETTLDGRKPLGLSAGEHAEIAALLDAATQ